ncbi:hypothetical protein B7463_g10754, partial [Scytalidium lignicola]
MSSEVVKKRGRPRKVVTEPVASEIAEVAPKQTTTRSKSTKVAPSKPTTKSKATTAKAKSADTTIATSKSAIKAGLSSTKATSKALNDSTIAKPAQTLPVTPETSKILREVQELSAKSASTTLDPIPSHSLDALPTNAPQTSPAPQVAASPPPPPNPPASAPPKAIPTIPLKSLNSTIVSDISARAGARANPSGPQRSLPPNYKPVARKITMTMVALPIAIVTSYVLYQRLVLGEERKHLVNPGTREVEEKGVNGSNQA